MSNSDKFFAGLGKVLLGLMVVGGLAAGAYYYGTLNKQTPVAMVVTPTLTPTTEVLPSPTVTLPSPTASGSLYSSGKYSLMLLPGWNKNESTGKLTLTKAAFSITISSGPGGGGPCLFAGDPPQDMAQVFSNFVEINGTQKIFRRGTSDNANWTVCEKNGTKFGFPTSFGYITEVTPATDDMTLFSEMDKIVASLNKE